MATYYSNRPIVTDGLVLYHDFGNPKCYSGTGTTCYDLTGNNHDGAISGSYTGSGGFVTESLGGLYTPDTRPDGVNSLTNNAYISFGLPSSLDFQPSTDDITLVVWHKINYFAPAGGGYTNASWRIWGRGTFQNSIGIDAISNTDETTGTIRGIVRGSGTENAGGQLIDKTGITTGSLHQTTYIYKQTGGVTHSLYIDGELHNSSNSGIVQQQTGSSFDGTPASPGVGRWMLTGPYAGGGDQTSGSITVYNCSLYNKALSADEVKQNFEALRGRYDI